MCGSSKVIGNHGRARGHNHSCNRPRRDTLRYASIRRLRAFAEHRPLPPYAVNYDCGQAQGLVAFYPHTGAQHRHRDGWNAAFALDGHDIAPVVVEEARQAVQAAITQRDVARLRAKGVRPRT